MQRTSCMCASKSNVAHGSHASMHVDLPCPWHEGRLDMQCICCNGAHAVENCARWSLNEELQQGGA